MISSVEFQKLVLAPPSRGRERKQEYMVESYDELLSKLAKFKGSYSAIPSSQYLRERIILAWSDHPMKQSAADEVVRLYKVVEAASQKFEVLSNLKDSVVRVTDDVYKQGNINTTGDALKAVTKAYQKANATMTKRYATTIEIIRLIAKLKPKTPENKNLPTKAPWGRFTVRLPYSEEKMSSDISSHLRLLQPYPAMLENQAIPAMYHEATAGKISSKIPEGLSDAEQGDTKVEGGSK